jgi:plastocyanin
MSKLHIPRAAGLTAIVILGALIAGCGSSSSSTTAGSSATSSSTPVSTPSAPTPAGSTPASSTPAPSAAGGAAQILKLSADPGGQLAYNTTTLTAKPGKVTIEFANASPLSHNVTVQEPGGGATLGATPTFSGATKSLTLNLKAGTYAFFCSVPGHRQAGMQGTLTVQ